MPAHGQQRALYVTDVLADYQQAYSAVAWNTPDLSKVATTSIEINDTRRAAQSATDNSDVDVEYLGSRSVSFTVTVETVVGGDTDAAKLILWDAYKDNTDIGAFVVVGTQTVTDANDTAVYGYWCQCKVREAPTSQGNDNVVSTTYILTPSNPTYFEDVKPTA